MQQVPRELLTLVFQYSATTPTHVVKLSHVNSDWNHITTSPSAWQFTNQPKLTSKQQYIDNLKRDYYENLNQQRRVRFKHFSIAMNRFLVRSLYGYCYLFVWFTTLALAKFPSMSHWIDFSYPGSAFYPLYLLLANVALNLTVECIDAFYVNVSQEKLKEVKYGIIWMLWLYAVFLLRSISANVVNMVNDPQGLPHNPTIFSSWYSIFLPLLGIVLAITAFVIQSEYKRIKPTVKTFIVSAMFLCNIFTVIALPFHLQGWRLIPLWLLGTPFTLQAIFWFCFLSRESRRGPDSVRVQLLFAATKCLSISANLIAYCYFGYSDWKLVGSLLLPMTYFIALSLKDEILFWFTRNDESNYILQSSC